MTATAHRKSKLSLYQVLLLDNDKSQDVEVQEADEVDFCAVKKHLRNGGSVFITSNPRQKLLIPKTKAQTNYNKSRKALGFLFRQQIRS
ncbi:MAG: hypothetical protein ACQCN4_00765 [Candidatus Bathyarchaeia archaeon]